MEQKGNRPIPYTISPESSRPKVVYIPSFRDILVPDQVIILEQFNHAGGIPDFPSPLMYTDAVETTQSTATGETLSRIVTLAPKFLVDPDAQRLMPFSQQAAIYRELAKLYQWRVDEKGVYFTTDPDEEGDPEKGLFYVIVDKDREGMPYTDIVPALGDVLFLEDEPDIGTMRHVQTASGRAVFEKLVHIEHVPGPIAFPFYAGLNYDMEILTPPYLEKTVLAPHYDPIDIRKTITPYIYTAPYYPDR